MHVMDVKLGQSARKVVVYKPIEEIVLIWQFHDCGSSMESFALKPLLKFVCPPLLWHVL